MVTSRNHIDVDEQNMTVTREYLQTQLKRILDYGVKKVFTRQTPSKSKARWATISINAAKVSASILKDDDLDDIKKQILAIEAKLV
jgi:hypothetical protein